MSPGKRRPYGGGVLLFVKSQNPLRRTGISHSSSACQTSKPRALGVLVLLLGVTYAYNKDMNNDTAPTAETHAHIEIESRDCDGMYSVGRVDKMTAKERTETTFSDLAFKDRVITSIISVHGYGSLNVTPEGVFWNESTEEGYRRVDVTWCNDTCATLSWQRDHSAEAAGY